FLAWRKPPGPVPLPFQGADLGFECVYFFVFGSDFFVSGRDEGERAGWVGLGLPKLAPCIIEK
ncbi:hypothetical protein, partial [Asaia astilbis]|uniref:hypothetical protein n=1 Tax=Asaia astilbis TaxID=610244 RepID=UPI00055C8F36